MIREDESVTDANGVIELEIPTPTEGIYALEARAQLSGKEIEASDTFIVESMSPEGQRLVGDGRLLKALSEETGGTYQTLDITLDALPLKPSPVARTTGKRQRDLWASPYVLIALVMIFGLEWWLRRRLGFL